MARKFKTKLKAARDRFRSTRLTIAAAAADDASSDSHPPPHNPASAPPRPPPAPQRVIEDCFICKRKLHPEQNIFKAFCSHEYHFKCIIVFFKNGGRTCPVCRIRWRQLAAYFYSLQFSMLSHLVNPSHSVSPVPEASTSRPPDRYIEPSIFNDDEAVSTLPVEASKDLQGVRLKVFPELRSIKKLSTVENFNIVLRLKAPVFYGVPKLSYPPIDLVVILDVSGSMHGTKLVFMQRAMKFVIENLDDDDRLSVIAFSSEARRLFPLRRMSVDGRRIALQEVDLLVATGTTNMAEGLRKAAKVMDDRTMKNPVAGIMLLSDGLDTHTISYDFCGDTRHHPNYRRLLPDSLIPDEVTRFRIPIHTFGLGFDHDAGGMYAIADITRGTYSFIEHEDNIVQAFAQCIGGLSSVVAKDLVIKIEYSGRGVFLHKFDAGKYPSDINHTRRIGWVDAGQLYADEKRDFLASILVPTNVSSVLKITCRYQNAVFGKPMSEKPRYIRVPRNEVPRREIVPKHMERYLIWDRVVDAMVHARLAADDRDLLRAKEIIESAAEMLSETEQTKDRDRVCLSLEGELGVMKEVLTNKQVYETSGRAYLLSVVSSHTWQRATTRGELSEGSMLYETPIMSEMVTRARTTTSNP
ncbi:E3 ubiquitin-protein ligase WAV3-like [Andrographis paniculata]|uniref:E3 ubiquitin-protein ligase WAV3-like n=1 Tax=Andrographis paniculata TaxID=175694 RepID=UPI0021E92422|nr:E3 ubiquitin-protein ligase WAV3-like [Andrographis paniculata]